MCKRMSQGDEMRSRWDYKADKYQALFINLTLILAPVFSNKDITHKLEFLKQQRLHGT